MWVSPNKKIKNLAFLTSQKRCPCHSTWRTLIEFDSFFRMYEVTAACVGKKNQNIPGRMFWYGRALDGGLLSSLVGTFSYPWTRDGILGGSAGGSSSSFGGRFSYPWDVDCLGGKGSGSFSGIFSYPGCFTTGCLGGRTGAPDGAEKHFREIN